ncbi:DPH5 [Hepatospora eriocheir]|uniref:DPH5 n=1 Tax=Hepatospora eriocheir TaxID=1081669 RepID=A0A1X0QKX0_9MICR|nr:DPH5 [Hepatospora eriocheir]
MIRCKNENINTKVIHNVSILNCYGCYGLYSYNFGKIISIPYFTDSWKPISFFDNIVNNYNNNLHTLCLPDIKTDENRFMSINEAIKEIEYAESVKKSNIFSLNTKLIAICRFSTDDEYVVYDTAENLLSRDFGKPLHSLIFPAKLSIIEKEMLEDLFKL